MSNVSMRDIYMQPDDRASSPHHLDSAIEGFVATQPEPFHVPSNLSYYTCGALQLAFYAAYALFGLWVLDTGYQWAIAADSALEIYARSVVFAAGSFVALTAISIVAKWVLIGRFKAQSIPIWSLAYFRFWVVKTMMRTSPVMAFTGTPIYNVYLRLMGARIGRNAVISCRYGPVCADMLSIGDNTILRKDTHRPRLSRAVEFHPHRPGRDRQQRLRRRSERDRYRHRDGRQHPARPRLVAAERPARAGRQALSRLARGRDDLGLLPDREQGLRRAAQRRLFLARTRGAVPRRRAGADPRLSFLGPVFGRRRSRSGLGASTLSLLGISAACVLRRAGRSRSRRSMRSRACA